MIRYFLAAQGLRLFSVSPMTRKLYRWIGDNVLARQRVRSGISSVRVERAARQLELFRDHGLLYEGMSALELGTGWVHWESVYLRAFVEAEICLYDVWDNRQFDRFLSYVYELRGLLSKDNGRENEKACLVLERILSCKNFDQVYSALGFEYIVEPKGDLGNFQSNRFALIYSSDVLEHIILEDIEEYVRDISRILKPGGYSYHQIVPADHLTIYDRSVNNKNYIRYSTNVWKLLFENKVQYINRVQLSKWLEVFERSGLELVNCNKVGHTDISELSIAPEFQELSQEDLTCTVFTIMHKKPN